MSFHRYAYGLGWPSVEIRDMVHEWYKNMAVQNPDETWAKRYEEDEE